MSVNLTSPKMLKWYLTETAGLRKRNNNVCDRACMKAWLQEKREEFEGQTSSRSLIQVARTTQEPTIKRKKSTHVDSINIKPQQSAVFSQKAKEFDNAAPYKFHLFNYDDSEITTNLMKFAKKLILVRK